MYLYASLHGLPKFSAMNVMAVIKKAITIFSDTDSCLEMHSIIVVRCRPNRITQEQI